MIIRDAHSTDLSFNVQKGVYFLITGICLEILTLSIILPVLWTPLNGGSPYHCRWQVSLECR